MLRLTLLIAAFVCVLFGSFSEAWAAKSPMCSDSAESIAAPPPLLGSSESVASGCSDDPGFSLQATPVSEGTPSVASANDFNQIYAVLPSTDTFSVTLEDIVHPRSEESVTSAEYRHRLTRPPSKS